MTTDPTQPPRCAMYCNEVLDEHADPVDPDGDIKNMCSSCREQLYELCHVVLPNIRKHGFHVGPGATDDERLRAMVDQADTRPRMRSALAFVDAVPLSDGRTFGDLWTDPRWPDGAGA